MNMKQEMQSDRETALPPAKGKYGTNKSPERDDQQCEVKLDRILLFCDENPSHQLMGVPRFKSQSSHFVTPYKDGRFQPYGRVQWFEDKQQP